MTSATNTSGWARRLSIKPESNKLLHIDFLRFIASVGIVVMHMADMLPGMTHKSMAPLYQFRLFVDLFFVISGLVIAKFYSERVTTRRGYTDFLVRRIARLLPLHWLTLSLYIGLFAASALTHIPVNEPSRYDPSCIIPNVLLINSLGVCSGRTFNFVSWSISAEMFLYILFPLFLWLGSNRAVWFVAAGVVGALLLNLAFPKWSYATYDWGAIRAIPSFVFGIGLFKAGPLLKRLPRPRLALLIATVLLIGSMMARVHPLVLLLMCYAVVAAAYAADLAGISGRLTSSFAAMGQLTYSLYMWHPPLMTFGITLVGGKLLRLNGTAMTIWIAVIAIVILPVVALLSLQLFETPMRRWITRRFTRGSQIKPGAIGRL